MTGKWTVVIVISSPSNIVGRNRYVQVSKINIEFTTTMFMK